MTTEHETTGEPRLPELSRNDVVCVSWVARPGQANVASFPATPDIRAVWLRETGSASVTLPRAS